EDDCAVARCATTIAWYAIRKQSRCRRSNRHLAWAEGDLLAGLDLDCLAGRRITAYSGSTITHHQNSEPGDFHALPLFQVLGDHADQVFQHFPTLFLCEVMLLRQRIGEMLFGDCCGCHGLCSLAALSAMALTL